MAEIGLFVTVHGSCAYLPLRFSFLMNLVFFFHSADQAAFCLLLFRYALPRPLPRRLLVDLCSFSGLDVIAPPRVMLPPLLLAFDLDVLVFGYTNRFSPGILVMFSK